MLPWWKITDTVILLTDIAFLILCVKFGFMIGIVFSAVSVGWDMKILHAAGDQRIYHTSQKENLNDA